METATARGKLTREDADDLLDRIVHTTRLDDLRSVDAVIEAVTEDPQIRGELFRLLDELLPEARFLASNTSSIPIAELAARTRRPERVIGLHFFSPVPVMRLVEIVITLDTTPETSRWPRRSPASSASNAVRAKDRSGFIVNMLLVPFLTAAVRMYEGGLRLQRGHRLRHAARLWAPDGTACLMRFDRPPRPLCRVRLLV